MRCLESSLFRYVGQTVTIFTCSGGISGGGFTGVLAHVGDGCIKIITAIGAAPGCAVGSECSYYGGGYGFGMGFGHGSCGEVGRGRECGCNHKHHHRPVHNHKKDCGCGRRERECKCREEFAPIVPYEYGYGGHGRNIFGSVTEIPVDKIVSFTHHAI